MDLLHAERDPIDLERRCHRIRRLLEDEPIQLADVVFYSRLHIEPDPAHLLDQVLPIGFHRPPPAVTVRPRIIDVPNIVHKHASEQDADRSRIKAKRLRPLVPELQLHPDPMLLIRQATLCGFVINANQDCALFTAVIDRDPGPSILKLLFNPGLAKFTDKLLLPVLVITVPEKLLDIQDAGVVIKSHIQTAHMIARPLLEEPKQAVKIPGPVLFEAPAALAGHIQTGPHSGVAVIQDRDAAEIQPLPVSVPAMAQLIPTAGLHSKQLYPGLRVLNFATYRQPIIENDIL